jgi:hypothetical protein
MHETHIYLSDSQTLNPVDDSSCHKIIQTIQYTQNYNIPLWHATICRIRVQFLAKSFLFSTFRLAVWPNIGILHCEYRDKASGHTSRLLHLTEWQANGLISTTQSILCCHYIPVREENSGQNKTHEWISHTALITILDVYLPGRINNNLAIT